MTLELPVEGPEGTQTLGLEFWGVVCARERSWGLNCMCVFFEAPDLFDNTQREGTGEWRGGEEGTPENTLIRLPNARRAFDQWITALPSGELQINPRGRCPPFLCLLFA